MNFSVEASSPIRNVLLGPSDNSPLPRCREGPKESGVTGWCGRVHNRKSYYSCTTTDRRE